MNIPAIDFLVQRCGSYHGKGANQEALPFQASLNLKSKIQDSLIEISFRAEDNDAAFHDEMTWISMDLLTQKLCLWTVSSNTPGVLCHALSEDSSPAGSDNRRFVFRLGDPEDKRIFRQEIALELRHDDTLIYAYSWAVPHESLTLRTRSILTKSDTGSSLSKT